MRKDSFIFSLFRIVLLGLLVGLMGMLYWSSLLVEKDLIQIKKELAEIKTESRTVYLARPEEKNAVAAVSRPHIDSKLPNLLIEDPFYETTLPKMLGPDFKPSGVRKQATLGKPDTLHPFSNFYESATWRSNCSVGVSNNQFGFFERYATGAAIKVEERSDDKGVEYWIHLREGMFWQPLEQNWFPSSINLAPHFLKKHPLTAHDFKLYFDVVMNPFVTSPLAVQSRDAFEDIMEVRVIDDLTFAVRWKVHPVEVDGKTEMRPKFLSKRISLSFTPLAGFVYLYYPDGKKIVENDEDPNTYRLNSTFAQTMTEHWAKNIIPSCGPWKFKGMTEKMIRFERNAEFYEPLACLVEGIEIEFKPAAENIWQDFKQGNLDAYNLQADQILEFENFLKSPSYLTQKNEGLKIDRLDYVFRGFNYIGWNQAKPLFASAKVRRALTMSIDRNRIIKQILNGLGIEISAPFYPFSDSYDPSIKPWPYDPALAKRLLEEEGFADFDGDGIIERKVDGKLLKFEFTLTYYVKNPATKSICEYISTALKEVGIKCNLNSVDIADMSALFDDKNFDAYYFGWALGDPPEDLRQLWHSSGATEKGSPNSIGFANKEVDEIIDRLSFEYNPEKRVELYHRFAAIFHKEAPYTLLFTIKHAMVYREYLQNVFLPVDRQDLIPGAVTAEPEPSIYWIKK